MSSCSSRRFAKAMHHLQETDPDTYKAVDTHLTKLRNQARSYRLQVPPSPSQSNPALDEGSTQESAHVTIARQAQTIAELTASVVQLEDDYDQVEAELRALTVRGAA